MLFLTILVVIIALILGLFAYAAMQPSAFRIARSTTINATPEQIFAFLNDFHQWELWSPWEKLDPTMKKTYGAAATGVGATYAWEGNKKVGRGSMEITESESPKRVCIALNFFAPIKANNKCEFTLTSKGEGTEVVWAMTGNNGLMARVMGVVMNMDKLVGKDFEKGLAELKMQAEQ